MEFVMEINGFVFAYLHMYKPTFPVAGISNFVLAEKHENEWNYAAIS